MPQSATCEEPPSVSPVDPEKLASLHHRLQQLDWRLQDLEDLEQWRGVTPLATRLRARLFSAALRSLAPRVGVLRQHPPRPMAIPARYASATVPDPAPSIAMVTPALNAAPFLERAIASVREQRYPSLTYVVQDGGSKDGTADLLRALPDLLWSSGPDGGQAAAINAGFDRAPGQIMGWLNADDILLPGSLATVARFFADHPDVDVVYGQRILIDETDGEIGRWIVPYHDDELIRFGDYIPQETLFWRRSLWDRVGGLRETLHFAMDWDLLLRFQEVGARMRLLPRFLGAFRVHARQKTSMLMNTTGRAEILQLRHRVHGRYIPAGVVSRAFSAYMDRSSLYHFLHRCGVRPY